MHPILLKLGPISVYSYGVMVALGFAIATILIYNRAARFNVDKNKIMDLAIIMLVSGIIGARLVFIILNLRYYISNPLEILNLARGGLVWYGGFLSALAATIFYIRKNNLDFWTVTDLVCPYVVLAQAFGRIGCFLNGCCYGIEVPPNYPFAVCYPLESVSRFPSQIYSAIALFLIFIILILWQERRRFKGEVFLGYCMLYSFKRLLIEFFRGDNPRIFFGLTISQVMSIGVLLMAAVVFINKRNEWKKRSLS